MEQLLLPFPEDLLKRSCLCATNSLFSCTYGRESVPCVQQFNSKAPPVALTTDEADQPNVIRHAQVESTSIVPRSRSRKQGCHMEAREAKGLEIIANSEITREGNIWIVPSQSSSKKYSVDFFIQTCTCQDFEEHRWKCKHIYAVEYLLQRESGMELPAPPKVKKTYRQERPPITDPSRGKSQVSRASLRTLPEP